MTPPQIMGGREPDPIGPEPGMGGCSVLLVQLNGWGGETPKCRQGVGNGVRRDLKCWGGDEEGIPKTWGEEGSLELWGWEWGILKCWGMG